MYLPEIELHEAATLDHAGELMERYAPDARFLAGGTDLFVDLKTRRLATNHLVSLQHIDAMRGVSVDDGHLRVGALTTPSQLNENGVLPKRLEAILDATRAMASPQIRNVATVGGNIASAVPCADLPPILMAMNASVVLWSLAGERQVPLDLFFLGVRQTALRPAEVLREIVVPKPPHRVGSAYARFALREGNAIAVAGVAAWLSLDDHDTIREARIVIGAVAPVPKLVVEAGSRLAGGPADEDAFQAAAATAMEAAEPISDVRGSADFRRELVGVLTRRALTTARQRALEEVA